MASLFRFARKPKAQPRKAPTGTSMITKGLATAQQPNLDSESGSSQPIQIREIVPTLATPFQRQQTYAQMKNDASVDVSMRLYKTPVLGAEFFMQPYSDNDIDLEISEFIWSNLAEGMSAPFLNALEDILHMYEDGYSLLEPVYERREWTPKRKLANTRQFVMLRKLAPRPSSNVKEIVYDDNGGPEEVIYNAIRKGGNVEEVSLPIANLLLFTFNRYGGDLTGKSLLRTAYSHWYYKTHLYKIDSIQKERHAIGVPRGKMLPGFKPSEKEVLRRLLRNLRTNEESFVVQTPNVEIDFIKLEGTMVDVLGSANHHNTMILLNVLGQFIGLGTTAEGGGRATAGAQSDMFMKSLKYVANQIVAQINMYLIPQLVVWNYPTKNFPKLQVRNIGETRDLQMFAAAIANLMAQDGLTKTFATENWLRGIMDAPSISEAEFNEFKKQLQPDQSENGNGNGNGNLTPEQVKSAKGNIKGDRTGFVGKPPNSAN